MYKRLFFVIPLILIFLACNNSLIGSHKLGQTKKPYDLEYPQNIINAKLATLAVFSPMQLLETEDISNIKPIGSCVVIRSDNQLHCLTAFHVVISSDIWLAALTLGDEKYIFPMMPIKADPELDLAIIGTNNYDGPNIAIQLIEEMPMYGDQIYTIGSPQGYNGMLAKGVIAGQGNCYLNPENINIQSTCLFSDLFATFGSSGAGIFNKRGELITIINQIPSNKLDVLVREPNGDLSKLYTSESNQIIVFESIIGLTISVGPNALYNFVKDVQ